MWHWQTGLVSKVVIIRVNCYVIRRDEGEGKVAVFSANRWNRRSRGNQYIRVPRTLHHSAQEAVLVGLKLSAPCCSGCKVRGLQYCYITSEREMFSCFYLNTRTHRYFEQRDQYCESKLLSLRCDDRGSTANSSTHLHREQTIAVICWYSF